MDNPNQKELREIFASNSDALVDEAFVHCCVRSFRRTQRRLLVLKVIFVCAAAGIVGLVLPSLADSAATISNWLSSALAELDLAAIIPIQLSNTLAEINNKSGGIDRAIAFAVVLVLIVRRYGLQLFRLRESLRIREIPN